MKNITTAQLDAACAAYYRAIGHAPNRAGIRAALHTIDLDAAVAADAPKASPDHVDETTAPYGQLTGGYYGG